MDQHISYVLPKKGRPIKKILAVRLQATGDVMIALPYLYDLKSKLPEGTVLDLLVREEAALVPQTFTIFNSIHVLKGGRNTKLQFLSFLAQYPKLFFKGYDIMLDLQNIRLTHVIRRFLPIPAWCTFDKTSTQYAGNRYKDTINIMQIGNVGFRELDCFKNIDEESLLRKFGLNKHTFYIVINPAGAFDNRNWALHHYITFCKLWLQNVNKHAKILVLGTDKIETRAKYLKEGLGEALIDLVSKTTQQEALHLLRFTNLMVSDDSGLMHMNYCMGNPTIGILGSTRNDWTNPNLPHTYFFNSSDLECGNCMLEKCKFEEIACLTRVKPEMVVEAALKLLDKKRS